MISPMYVHSLSIPYSFVQQRIYWTKPGHKIVQGLSRLCPSLSAQCQLKVKCPYFVQALSMSKVCPDKNVLDKSMSKLCPYFVQCLSMSNVCPHFVQAPLNSCPLFVLIHTVCPNYANPRAISPIEHEHQAKVDISDFDEARRYC